MNNNNMNMPQERKQSLPAYLFGQFATRGFWREMFRLVFQEVFAAILMTGGGMLMWYGRQKRNQDIPDMTATPGSGPGTVADRAFGGFQPRPSYQPSGNNNYSVPQAPAPDRFPGF